MKPVDQTVSGIQGNCAAAVLASIFEIPLSEAPDLVMPEDAPDGAQDERINDWLRPLGLAFIQVRPQHLPKGVIHEISGKSPRGDWYHGVVGQDGEMVHDPHPSRAGTAGDELWGIYIVRDPALVRRAVLAYLKENPDA